MILIYHLKSLTDEYSIILATWPFGEPPPPLTWLFVAFWLTPPPPCWPRGFWMPPSLKVCFYKFTPIKGLCTAGTFTTQG